MIRAGVNPDFSFLFILFISSMVLYVAGWLHWGHVQAFYQRHTSYRWDFSLAQRTPAPTAH
jgi:hypothetical protein